VIKKSYENLTSFLKPILGGIMRKVVLIGIMLVLTVQAQQIPVEVQKIMDDYKKNPTGGFGFNAARELYKFDAAIHASDIEIGVPFQEYYFVNDSLYKLSDTVPVTSVISPGPWRIPIRANGKFIYALLVSNYKAPWRLVAMQGPPRFWQKMRETWPEATGNNPIIIMKGLHSFLHFPQQGKYNLFYLAADYSNDSLSMITSRDVSKLDDSRKILKFLKTHKEW
jgi:hypothetical protein